MTDCAFLGNSTGGDGGGIYSSSSDCVAVSNCMFVGNTARNGGGMYGCNVRYMSRLHEFVTDCTFSGNSAEEDGGGLYVDSPFRAITEYMNAGPTDCVFSDNQADRGGGMYVALEVGTYPDVARCSFYQNSARLGAGMFNEGFGQYEGEAWDGLRVTNCLLVNNAADEAGGGLYNLLISPRVTNCTFYVNFSLGSGGAMFNDEAASALVRNCILWDDWPEEIIDFDETSNSIVTFSDVLGGYPGEGNMDLDPLFVNPGTPLAASGIATRLDFRLQSDSPCIDAGMSEGAFDDDIPDEDIMGIPRPQGAGVDMGAYEFTDADSDDDTIPDSYEGAADPDGDEIPNYLDTDSDNDGYTDRREAVAGSDPYDPTSWPTGSPATEPTTGGRGGSSGPCFVATAAYGTPAAGEICILREFRDKYLLTNRAGAAFVRVYYRLSPPAARFISAHEPARAAVRAVLTPIVAIARLILTFPLAVVAALLAGAAIGLSRVRRKDASAA